MEKDRGIFTGLTHSFEQAAKDPRYLWLRIGAGVSILAALYGVSHNCQFHPLVDSISPVPMTTPVGNNSSSDLLAKFICHDDHLDLKVRAQDNGKDKFTVVEEETKKPVIAIFEGRDAQPTGGYYHKEVTSIRYQSPLILIEGRLYKISVIDADYNLKAEDVLKKAPSATRVERAPHCK